MTVISRNNIKYFFLITVMVLANWFAGCQMFDSYKGNEMPPDTETVDFTLIDQNGQPFTLSDHKGKVVLLFFGYTYCPDVCPMTLSTWKRVQEALKDRSDEVKFVYITVDPERDTPERLKDHIEIFSKEFTGLTSSMDTLQQVFSSYGVYHDRHKIPGSETGYLMGHTSQTFMIDKAGNWRLLLPYGAPVEDLVHDIELLLRE